MCAVEAKICVVMVVAVAEVLWLWRRCGGCNRGGSYDRGVVVLVVGIFNSGSLCIFSYIFL